MSKNLVIVESPAKAKTIEGYLGKDFTNLSYYMDIHGVEDKELFLEILTYLESRAIKQSQEQLKREREKLKRKH